MKVAVVGSRGLEISNLGEYISNAEEIVSGGAVGVDSCAANYAKIIKKHHNLPCFSLEKGICGVFYLILLFTNFCFSYR